MVLRGSAIALMLASATSLAVGAAAAQPAPDAKRQAERDLFEKVVEIPTVHGRGQMPKLTALLKAELRKTGITNVVVKDHDDTQTLIARWPAAKPSGKKPILLLAHMDVVDARPSDWKHDPFTFREEGDYYLGRGASDNKAGLTGIVLALQNLKRAGFAPTRDIVILFTGDEETDAWGARRAASEWRELIDAEFALNSDVGGGSVYRDGRVESFGLQIAEKTYADFTLTATNRGGHSSRPRPDNAIYALAGALKAVEAHRFPPMINEATRGSYERKAANDKGAYGELVRKWLANPADRETADLLEANDPGYTRTRCVATQIAGGHAPNALPQKAEATVNCRIFPGVRIEAVQAELQALAGPEVKVTLKHNSKPSDVSPLRADVLEAHQAAIATRFKDAPIVPGMSAGATDGSYLRNAGIPVYGVGSGWSLVGETSGAHGLDERVLIEGFHGQIPMWEELLRRLAG